MGNALAIDIKSERELHLLKLLARGSKEFKELNTREQLIIYNSNVDTRDVVDEEELKEFEKRLALTSSLPLSKRAALYAKSILPLELR